MRNVLGNQCLGVVALLISTAAMVLPASAQVKGTSAVGVSSSDRIAPGVDQSLDDRLEGATPPQSDQRYDDQRSGYDDRDRNYDRRDYDRRDYDRYDGRVRGEDGRNYDGYTDRYRGYTDDSRRYTDRYGYEGRNYYDRSYDRDYRRRTNVRPRVDYNYYGGKYSGSSLGISVDLGDITLGYRDGYRDRYYVYYNGRKRYRHHDWRRGYTYYNRCHPVRYTEWRYRRPVTIVSTMCYDRYGYGYVVPGSGRRYY